MFDGEEYNINKINQQDQSFSDKTLLPLDEYLEKIRPELIKLMIKNREVELIVNLVFGSKSNPNNERNTFIRAKSVNTDEIFDQLIKKYEDLKNTDFL